MKIVLDNIIYSLQKSGGGSVYWTELIKRFMKSDNELIFFDQKEPNENLFRKTLHLDNLKTESKWSLAIRKYLPFTEKILGKYIFHSSYYRCATSPNAIHICTFVFIAIIRTVKFWLMLVICILSYGLVFYRIVNN